MWASVAAASQRPSAASIQIALHREEAEQGDGEQERGEENKKRRACRGERGEDEKPEEAGRRQKKKRG